MLWKVLDGLRRSLDGSGMFAKAFGKLWGRFWTVLGVSGKLWWSLAGLWTALDGALNAALERIWTALDGLDGFEIGLDGSGSLWAALGSFE